MMMSNIPVLIVGAGPSGLFMACELARHGIPFRIIDKKAERTLTSNAVWIQTRTIEIFDEAGIAEQFLRNGQFCKAINLYSHGKSFVKISLEHLDSIYQFALTLPQSETERILTARLEELNHHVERPVELVSCKVTGNVVEVQLQKITGEFETLHCDWIIGCDGANSTIRQVCKIVFPGEDLREQFVVADAKMDSFLHTDEIHVFLDKGTVLAALPLGEEKYRLGANLHLDHPRKLFTEKEVKEIVIERAQGDFNVQSVSWISPFWIHSKIVENMRHGSIFLVGDAAHIHSPADGQGMNAGLQDAYNLAWKLAMVINGKAKADLLDSYQLERHPIVNEIVDRSESFTKMMLFENPLLIKLRNFIYRIFHSQTFLSKKYSQRITQLDIQYKKSPIIDYHEKINSHSPQPGERAPNVIMHESKHLHDYMRNTKHNVLLFTGNTSSSDLTAIKELHLWFNNNYRDLIQSHIIAKSGMPGTDNVILDMDGIIHDRYHVNQPCLFILRPDCYIAYTSAKLDSKRVQTFLERFVLR